MQLVLTLGSDVCGSAIVCFQVCFLHILPIRTSVWLQGTHWGFLAVTVSYFRNSSRPVIAREPTGVSWLQFSVHGIPQWYLSA